MSASRTDPHQQLLDDARHADAVAARTQRRLLEEAEQQDATFLGSLEDAAERGVPLVVETTVARRLRGYVRALAADHVVIDGEHGTAWVSLWAIAVVRAPRLSEIVAGGGDRPPRPSVSFARALREVVEQRASLEVVSGPTNVARGTAVAVGRDVLTLREADGGTRVLVHLPRAAIVLHRPG